MAVACMEAIRAGFLRGDHDGNSLSFVSNLRTGGVAPPVPFYQRTLPLRTVRGLAQEQSHQARPVIRREAQQRRSKNFPFTKTPPVNNVCGFAGSTPLRAGLLDVK